MSEVTNVAEVAVATPTKKAVKKTTKKVAAKKAVKKVEVKKAAPAKTEKKDGLRKPQERILKCLAKTAKPLTRAMIAEKAPVDVAACVEYLGSHDDNTRLANDKKHFPSLISLGLVKHEQHDIDNKDVVVYLITAKGKATAAKL